MKSDIHDLHDSLSGFGHKMCTLVLWELSSGNLGNVTTPNGI